MPHLAVDAVTTAAKIVCELQTLVSRELDPLEPGVISITTLRAGEAHNVIPPSVQMTGTIRSLTASGMQFLQQRVRELAGHIAAANRCEANVNFPGHVYPPTVNDTHCWELAQKLSGELVGAANVQEIPPVMGGEDFSYYTERTAGCFIGLGMRNEAEDAVFNVHHPRFRADESALPLGAALHVAFALSSLQELRGAT
jgi:IAA-amino acid hydrolase